jgi:hypothetical protein
MWTMAGRAGLWASAKPPIAAPQAALRSRRSRNALRWFGRAPELIFAADGSKAEQMIRGFSRPFGISPTTIVAATTFPMNSSPESSTQEVLAGLVERVTFHNAENGFCVLRAKARGHRDLVTVVGHAATIAAGEWIMASGEWVNDRTHGQQFKARFLRTSAPTSVDGIEKYLSSSMIRGIGPVYSEKLVRVFGDKVFDVIEAEPDRLREVDGIGLQAQLCRHRRRPSLRIPKGDEAPGKEIPASRRHARPRRQAPARCISRRSGGSHSTSRASSGITGSWTHSGTRPPALCAFGMRSSKTAVQLMRPLKYIAEKAAGSIISKLALAALDALGKLTRTAIESVG